MAHDAAFVNNHHGTGHHHERAIVIGAGAAGLAASTELRRRGVDPLVLERASVIGGGWLSRYEGLRLNTVRQLSGLRGSPIPRRAGRWVRGEDYARYLRRCAGQLRIHRDLEVERIESEDGRWVLSTSDGVRRARSVVVATGYDRVPHLPDWPGKEAFEGELLHSSSYRDAARYRRRDMLVIGPGNSGSEIATQLAAAGAGRVRLSVRTPVNLMPATILGIPATWIARLNESGSVWMVDRASRLIQRIAFGDLRPYGMGPAPLGVATELRNRGLGPVLERGSFVPALKRGEIEIVAAVTEFTANRALLADGTAIEPEVVIAATGYRPGLERLVGDLGVLDERGLPLVSDGGEMPGAEGLYFNGYWLPLSGQLPALRRSSPRIARAIVRRDRVGAADPSRA